MSLGNLKPARNAIALGVTLFLLACGGGNVATEGAAADLSSTAAGEATSSTTEHALAVTAAVATASNDTYRFLNQASFGPTDSDVARVSAIGINAWIDEQAARSPKSVRAYVEKVTAARRLTDPAAKERQGDVVHGIWAQMLTDPAQLRQRVAYALSQIFVVSLLDGGVHSYPRAAAAYYDMLAQDGLGNYRDLLERVARHPIMARYLSSLANRKADLSTGRVPDENFAREVMQLFSIGLYELNADGTQRLVNGAPVETYGPADVAGLAGVFTGWSWACTSFPSDSCFKSSSGVSYGGDQITFTSLVGYPQWHSTEEKRFLGVTVPAQSTPNPNASLKAALDRIFMHPNVGPFIGRQLIQRLVTSNPSPAYVAAVSAAFANNGSGVRGDMKAVVKAVLMHPEARTLSPTTGKVREPVLRRTAFIRAFPFSSASGDWLMGNSDDPATQLGQTPLRAPNVFNFYRPGYVPPGSQAAAHAMVAPEMQIVDETSVAGYVNQMRYAIGKAAFGNTSPDGGRDIRLDFSREIQLAPTAAALVDRINTRLLYGTMSAALRTELINATELIAIPALKADKSNSAQIAAAIRNRVTVALLLATASPEYIVQK